MHPRRNWFFRDMRRIERKDKLDYLWARATHAVIYSRIIMFQKVNQMSISILVERSGTSNAAAMAVALPAIVQATHNDNHISRN